MNIHTSKRNLFAKANNSQNLSIFILNIKYRFSNKHNHEI